MRDTEIKSYFENLVSAIRSEFQCSTHFVKEEHFNADGSYKYCVLYPSYVNPAYSEFERQADLIRKKTNLIPEQNRLIYTSAVLRFGIGECSELSAELFKRFCLDTIKPNGKVHTVDVCRSNDIRINHGFAIYVPNEHSAKMDDIIKTLTTSDTSLERFLLSLPSSAVMIDPWRNACCFLEKNNVTDLIAIFKQSYLTRVFQLSKGQNKISFNESWLSREIDNLYTQINALLLNESGEHFSTKEVCSTILTEKLEKLSELPFTAKCNNEFYVDAYATITSKEDEKKAMSLRDSLGASARFEQTSKARFFVIPRINDPGTLCKTGEVLGSVISRCNTLSK